VPWPEAVHQVKKRGKIDKNEKKDDAMNYMEPTKNSKK
jgi:hypothetical protein